MKKKIFYIYFLICALEQSCDSYVIIHFTKLRKLKFWEVKFTCSNFNQAKQLENVSLRI